MYLMIELVHSNFLHLERKPNSDSSESYSTSNKVPSLQPQKIRPLEKSDAILLTFTLIGVFKPASLKN